MYLKVNLPRLSGFGSVDPYVRAFDMVQVGPLKNLFQAGGVRTDLVFISSCSSEFIGKAFVEAGVPHVVAVKREQNVTGE